MLKDTEKLSRLESQMVELMKSVPSVPVLDHRGRYTNISYVFVEDHMKPLAKQIRQERYELFKRTVADAGLVLSEKVREALIIQFKNKNIERIYVDNEIMPHRSTISASLPWVVPYAHVKYAKVVHYSNEFIKLYIVRLGPRTVAVPIIQHIMVTMTGMARFGTPTATVVISTLLFLGETVIRDPEAFQEMLENPPL